MTEEVLLVGKSDTGDGNVIRLPGRYKQFIASLSNATAEQQAVVEVYVTSDAARNKSALVATFTLTGAEPGEICPIVEMLVPNVFARVVSIDAGEVHVYGVSNNDS